MQNILVTGGAGYIGSHTCKALYRAGYQPITYDNLCRGFRKSVKWGPLIEGDLHDFEKLKRVLQDESISAVVHFAAYAYVKESIEKPQMYFHNNVEGSILLIEAMIAAGVKNIVFSSTCATYGESEASKINENHPQRPINPYGLSKWMVERILEKYQAHSHIRICGLRYFNVAGADSDLEIGESHDPEPHLIPCLIEKAVNDHPMTINGDDYPTPDGTCVRDFTHVSDLADAHVLALRNLLAAENKHHFYNLGTSQGHSLKEIGRAIAQALGKSENFQIKPRRPGDPARLVADAQTFQTEFQWAPQQSDLETLIESAIQWSIKKS